MAHMQETRQALMEARAALKDTSAREETLSEAQVPGEILGG